MNKKTSGFTLLEVLIALSIFAIIAVTATTVLSTVFKAREATAQHTNELEELQLASILIKRDIRQIVNRPVRSANGNLIPAFIGKRTLMAFTRTGHSNPMGLYQRSNLQRVHYMIKNRTLIRITWPRLDRVSSTKPSERILLNHVIGGHFRYLSTTNTFYDYWPPTTTTNHPANIAMGFKREIFPKAIEAILTIRTSGIFKMVIPIG